MSIDVNMIKIYKKLTKRVIAYNPIFKDITGSTTSGVLLSQIHYWAQEKDFGEFYKTNEEFMAETSLGSKEFKNAKKNLIELGFIECILRGVPAKTFYKIDMEKIIQSMLDNNPLETAEKSSWAETVHVDETAEKSSWAERAQLVGPKGSNKMGRKGPAIYIDARANTTSKITSYIPLTPKGDERDLKTNKLKEELYGIFPKDKIGGGDISAVMDAIDRYLDPEDIIAAAKSYIQQEKEKNHNGKFIKQLRNWLNVCDKEAEEINRTRAFNKLSSRELNIYASM